jgi:hypothetical protein
MEAIVVTSCSNRKTLPPGPSLRARDLATGALENVVQHWFSRLDAANGRVPASQLYCGRGFGESVSAAQAIRAPLFIVSAGGGLIPAQIAVPSYGMKCTKVPPLRVRQVTTTRDDHLQSSMIKNGFNIRRRPKIG